MCAPWAHSELWSNTSLDPRQVFVCFSLLTNASVTVISGYRFKKKSSPGFIWWPSCGVGVSKLLTLRQGDILSKSPQSFRVLLLPFPPPPLRPDFVVSPASRHCRTDFPLGFPSPRNSFPFNLTSPASPDLCVAVRTSLTAYLKLTRVLTSRRTQLWGWTQPRRRCCCCCWFWAHRRSSKVSRATDGPLSGKTHRRLLGLRVQCYNAFFWLLFLS